MKSGSVKLGKEKAAETASETARARHELPFSLAAASHSAPTASLSLSSDAEAGSFPALSSERIVGGMGGEGDGNPEQKQVGGEVEPSDSFPSPGLTTSRPSLPTSRNHAMPHLKGLRQYFFGQGKPVQTMSLRSIEELKELSSAHTYSQGIIRREERTKRALSVQKDIMERLRTKSTPVVDRHSSSFRKSVERNSVSPAKRNSTAASQSLRNSVERHSVERHSSPAKRNSLTVASSSSALAARTVSPPARVSHSDAYTQNPTLTQPSAAAVVSLVPDCRLSAACVCCYMFVCVLNFYLDLHNYDCLQHLSPPLFLFYMLMLS